MTVELQLGKLQGGDGVGGRTLDATGVLAVGGSSHNPRKVLGGVVEVQTDVGGLGGGTHGDGFVTCELQLLNKILVGDLCEATTLVHIQINIVNPQSGGGGDGGADTGGCRIEGEIKFNFR